MHDLLNIAVEYILQIVGDMGYIGIFIMMTIESSFFPFPSEVAMIPAGYFASLGEMSFTIALLTGTVGAMTGASINYFLGKKLGGPIVKTLVKKYGKYVLISEKHYNASEIYFKEHGSITTFLARFIPAVRQLISLPAGVFKMKFSKFIFYTGAGAFIWNFMLMGVGYVAGENKELIKEYSGYALIGVLVLGAIVGFTYYLKNKKIMNSDTDSIKSEKRTIFIGDIQGCYKELKLLLEKIDLKEEDKVYFVGDLINKGPKSYKVLKYVYKNRKQFKSVVGNHEINFLRFLDGKGARGDSEETFLHLKKKLSKHPEILKYLREMPRYIEEDDFIMVHAGVFPGKKLKEHTIDEITRVREIDGKPWYEYYKGKKKIIYGHWAIEGIRIRENTVGIDTGCVYGKSLTAYVLETGDIYTQQAEDIYVNVYKK